MASFLILALCATLHCVFGGAPSSYLKADKVIVGCSDARNAPQAGRLATKLQCQDLLDCGLWILSYPGNCTFSPGMSSTVGKGSCDQGLTRVNSLYVEFEWGNWRVVATNGIPLHDYQKGAKSANPNYACEQYKVMTVPKAPYKGTTRDTMMGPIGMSITGAFINNHKSAEAQCNAAAITEAPTLDACGGHADPMMTYHYHGMPKASCFNYKDCALLGYLNDGFPVYGFCQGFKSCYEITNKTVNATSWVQKFPGGPSVFVFNGCDSKDYTFNQNLYNSGACQLDDANGRYYNGQYSYFFTPDFPFVMPKQAAMPYWLCALPV